MGLTVISTNVGGMPYLIKNGVDGILVDKGDAIAMANEISKLILVNNQDLAINARNKIEEFGRDRRDDMAEHQLLDARRFGRFGSFFRRGMIV